MATAVEVLKALHRVDPETAGVVERFVAGEMAERGWHDWVVKNAPAAARFLTGVIDGLRADMGAAYVGQIAKSADQRQALEAAAQFEAPLREAVMIRDGLVDEYAYQVSKEDISRRGKQGGSWVQRVNRDQKGRFTRSLSTQAESSPSQWDFPDQAKRRGGVRPLPESVQSDFQPAPSGRGIQFVNMTDADAHDRQEKDKRFLYAMGEVDDLKQELRRAFGREAESMLQINVRLKDAVTGEQTWTGEFTPGQETPDWGPDLQAQEIRYGVNPEVASEKPQRADEITGQLALSQIPGVSLTTADPRLWRQLGQAVNGAGGEQGFDRPKTQKVAQALNAGGKIASGIPGLQSVGTSLTMAGQAVDNAAQLKQPLAQAAYRMRGTTKTPDKGLVAAVQGDDLPPTEQFIVDALVAGWDGRPNSDKFGEAMNKLGDPKDRKALINAVSLRLQDGSETADQALRGAQRDVAARELLTQMMRQSSKDAQVGGDFRHREDNTLNPQNMRRLIESVARGVGRGFPSEGVILDESGKVKSQAVGLGEDHYLPFDLANMKYLRGGSYVRTRTTGGPTSEDMRTLIYGNARAGTVVSGSGVFDVELAPDLRGGRRFNDKVAKIPEIYERILDEVENGGHYAVDLPAETKQRIRAEVMSMGGMDADAQKKAIRDREDEARRMGQEWTAADEQQVVTDVLNRTNKVRAGIEQRRSLNAEKVSPLTEADLANDEGAQEEIKRLRADRQKAKVRELGINAEGYDVALKTLQHYFPYYIRNVTRRDLKEFVDGVDGAGGGQYSFIANSRGKDRGYVQPGRVTADRDGLDLKLRGNKSEDRKKRADDAKAEEKKTPEGGAAASVASPATTKPTGQVPVDAGGNKALDDARSQVLQKAAMEWSAKLSNVDAGNSAAASIALGRYMPDENGNGSVKWLNGVGKADAASAFTAALGSSDASVAAKAIQRLTDPEQAAAVLSSESKEALAAKLIYNDHEDDDAYAKKKEQLWEHLDNMVDAAQVLFATYKPVPAGNPSKGFDGNPLLLPEAAAPTTTVADVEKLLKQDVAGVPADLRAVVMTQQTKTENASLTDYKLKAMEAQRAAGKWAKYALTMPPGDRGDPQKLALKLSDIFNPDDAPVAIEGDFVVALEKILNTSGDEETAQRLLSSPEQALTRLTDAAVVQYSLLHRAASLLAADDPKGWAAFQAAQNPKRPLTKSASRPNVTSPEVMTAAKQLIAAL